MEELKDISLEELVASVKDIVVEGDLEVKDIQGPLRPTTTPIRIEGLMFCLCLGGSAKVRMDLQEIILRERTLMPVGPKNFITLEEVSGDFKAKMVVVSRQIFESIVPKLTELLPLMLNFPAKRIVRLEEEDYRELCPLFDLLKHKMSLPPSPFKRQKVITLLQVALFEMLEIQHRRSGGKIYKKSRKEEIMARFIISVSENFREHRDVIFYANQLCITPKHLSAVVKELSGRPAGEWIDQYVIMEAKIMLRTTDYSVQQIATSLNFANQSFFGKYFKHVTGMAPTAYRNTIE